MAGIKFLLNVLPTILFLEGVIFLLMLLGQIILKTKKNNVLLEGGLLVLHIFLATILIIWVLMIDSFIILSSIFFYYLLFAVSIDINMVKVQILLFALLAITILSNFLLYKYVFSIINNYIKNRKVFTDKYISFITKFMTAFTLFITGIYTLINDFGFGGITITTVSFSTVILSVLEIIRLIQSEEWK